MSKTGDKLEGETAKKEKLWKLCQAFVAENKISCAEAIWQCDWVSLNSPEFIAKVVRVVGYHKAAKGRR